MLRKNGRCLPLPEPREQEDSIGIGLLALEARLQAYGVLPAARRSYVNIGHVLSEDLQPPVGDA